MADAPKNKIKKAAKFIGGVAVSLIVIRMAGQYAQAKGWVPSVTKYLA
jgi:hypothetical protein